MTGKRVLVIGSGGREHAICWKLAQSDVVEKIYALPGSYGIQQVYKCENLVGLPPTDFNAIGSWCQNNNIDLVVVGPEDPLAKGLVDVLHQLNIKCFGPQKRGALIESDKKWAKDFMVRHNIPTSRFESFTNVEQAKKFINSAKYNALVVKASGLAAGKGVIVAANTVEACQAVNDILGEKKYGTAGEVIVIEECLIGEEVSVLAFVDSQTVRVMLPAQDHKRLKENDKGPNTGGMGAYCPCPLISQHQLQVVEEKILQKAVDGLRSEGIQYCGVLYAGLMLTADGPKVLEFNCRFGDPETQVILPLLESDLFEIMYACSINRLHELKLQWKPDLSAVGVVMASAGYPESSTKGCTITGIPKNTDSEIIFHSGIATDEENNLTTNGGRVLIAVALRRILRVAASEATGICKKIKFSGREAQFRSDIAHKAFAKTPISYKDSGVDIDAGDDLVQRIKPLSRGTYRKGVVGGLGGFGGIFSLNELPYKNPILSEAAGGVGTKTKLAIENELYDTIGYDLVAMCANNILESGAEPVAFLDYIACGKLHVPVAAQIVKGVADGCRDAICALLGGETAEMPSVYEIGEYDLAGYCLGVGEEGTELPRFDQYTDGDLIIGFPSSGLHCSGFDVIYEPLQKLGVKWSDQSEFENTNTTLGQQLMTPSRIYVKEILPLLQFKTVKAISHINGGLNEGLSKLCCSNYQLALNLSDLHLPDVFGWLTAKLHLSSDTLLKHFNCGLGLVFVVAKDNQDWKHIEGAQIIGRLKPATGDTPIYIENFTQVLNNSAAKFNGKSSAVQLPKHPTEDIINDLEKALRSNVKHRSESFLSQGAKRLTRIPKNFKDPVLIIGTDGVGTKIKIAQTTGINSTVGIDLVAMCVNDIICNGAEPLTFSTYYAGNRLDKVTANDVLSGIINGSQQANCSLTEINAVEVPLIYKPTVYDLAGFSLGIAEKNCILPKMSEIKEGDILIGIPSTGIHSNGFSLVHAVMRAAGVTFSDKFPFSEKTFGEELLVPTQIYVKAVMPLITQGIVKAVAHITGGGLIENIPRVLTKKLGVRINSKLFTIPPVFAWLSENGAIPSYEMLRTFNCGLGMILIIDPKYLSAINQELKFEHRAVKVGRVITRISTNTPQVVVEQFETNLLNVRERLKFPWKRVAVLISGSGTNLQALIDATRTSAMGLFSEIVLVISNKKDAYGLVRAANARIPTAVIIHSDYKTREEFDAEMSNRLKASKVDIICLAGFMRVLSQEFVFEWKGRLINIHPSLLPKYPGLHVQQKALDAGDSESGCSVHFVDEGVDTGAIIVQEKVPILSGDTVDALTKRIQKAEHYAFPQALRLVATNKVKLGADGKVIWD